MLIRHFFPYLVGGLMLAGFILTAVWPFFLWPSAVLIIVVLIAAAWLLSDRKFNSVFWHSLITPFLLFLSFFCLLFFWKVLGLKYCFQY
jgi:hypothetical protein